MFLGLINGLKKKFMRYFFFNEEWDKKFSLVHVQKFSVQLSINIEVFDWVT